MPTSVGTRFRILRPHAQGGIGKVSVAFDAELQREVALKQIKPERADDADSRARFLLEAEVTGRLEHPGIVPVYGLGMDDDGRPFYAMRFVRGTSFEEAISGFHRRRRGPPPRSAGAVAGLAATARPVRRRLPDRRLRPQPWRAPPRPEAGQRAARAVQRVAGGGLGPGQGARPRAGRADGRAAGGPTLRTSRHPSRRDRAVRQSGAGARTGDVPVAAGCPRAVPEPMSGSSEPPLGFSSSTETVAGTAFGTPAYMSPEQAEGRLDQLGPASDVYSLGAMLYTLLSGRPPFDYVWCDVTALLDRVRMGEFPPPTEGQSARPPALEAVCLKAMAEPAGGPVRLGDRAGRGDRAMAGRRAGARRPRAGHGAAGPLGPAAPADRRRRRRPAADRGGALSAGIVLVGREQRRTERQRLVAEEQRRRADLKSDEATAGRGPPPPRRDQPGQPGLSRVPRRQRRAGRRAAGRLPGGPPRLGVVLRPPAGPRRAEELDERPRSGLDVWCVAFSPDGARVAAGTGPWGGVGEDLTGELVVRDVHDGREAFAMRGLNGAVQAVAYSPDGRTLAAAHGLHGQGRGARSSCCSTPTTGGRSGGSAERGVQILSLAFAPTAARSRPAAGTSTTTRASGYVRIRDAADRRRARGRAIAGGPAACWPWRSRPTAGPSRWPAATSSTSATSPTPDDRSSIG